MAWCLSWALDRGFYWIFVAPMLAALVVACVWRLVLIGSHCRNRGVATLGSLVLGLLLYLGYYHIGMLQLVGPRHARRIDMLPRYIQFRMKTDMARRVQDRRAGNAPFRGPDAVQQGFN